MWCVHSVHGRAPVIVDRCFTWKAGYFPSQWKTSLYRVKLFSIKCNPEIEYAWAPHGLPNTWQWILFIFWRDAILWVSHGCVHKCPPLVCAKGKALLRVLLMCWPVGGTVSMWPCSACWYSPAVSLASQQHYIQLFSGAFMSGSESLCLLMIMQLIKEPIILTQHIYILIELVTNFWQLCMFRSEFVSAHHRQTSDLHHGNTPQKKNYNNFQYVKVLCEGAAEAPTNPIPVLSTRCKLTQIPSPLRVYWWGVMYVSVYCSQGQLPRWDPLPLPD